MVASAEEDLERACPKSLRSPPLLIGVAGGTASGKTTVCHKIKEKLADDRVQIISMDNFYRPLTDKERFKIADFNFDHPDAFDEVELVRCLDALRAGKPVDIPVYDFKTHSRSDRKERVNPAEVILFEGILVLHINAIVKRLNMKVYVDTDDDLRLSRRILRDVEDRGRDVAGVIQQYTRFVKPAQDKFVTPSRKIADIIIPWHDRMNMMAVELVTEHLKTKLKQHPLVRQYPNLDVMPDNPLVKEMHTIIRDRTTGRNDFVFYSDRLIRLVVEMGLGYLPFREKSILTPEGYSYVGVDFARSLCGVSIVWSGEAMEAALRDVCQGIKIGKILVQRQAQICDDMYDGPACPPSEAPGELIRVRTPQPADDVEANLDNTSVKANDLPLVYDKLPADIATRHVLLLDPILSSGYTVVRAIETLLKRGVKEDKIYLLCLIAAPQGIHAVCKRFPRMRVLTSEIDSGLNDFSYAIPGIGNFGDRYFHL